MKPRLPVESIVYVDSYDMVKYDEQSNAMNDISVNDQRTKKMYGVV
ncbi:hypothetical protein [Pseudogracilibacillus auburnensis]|nr:hypothetical protein [Pseudogracilibacillus auburnensis]